MLHRAATRSFAPSRYTAGVGGKTERGEPQHLCAIRELYEETGLRAPLREVAQIVVVGWSFVTWFAVPRAQLALESGDELLRVYASSEHGTRSFCSRCGTSLFCENQKHPDQVDIPLANMQGPIDRAPQVHVYFDDRAPWVEVSDALPRLGGASGMEPLDPEPGA